MALQSDALFRMQSPLTNQPPLSWNRVICLKRTIDWPSAKKQTTSDTTTANRWPSLAALIVHALCDRRRAEGDVLGHCQSPIHCQSRCPKVFIRADDAIQSVQTDDFCQHCTNSIWLTPGHFSYRWKRANATTLTPIDWDREVLALSDSLTFSNETISLQNNITFSNQMPSSQNDIDITSFTHDQMCLPPSCNTFARVGRKVTE